MVPQHDESAPLHDAAHFAHRPGHALGGFQVVQGGDRQRQVERVVGEGQGGRDGRVGAAQAALAGLTDHRRRQVDAEDVVAIAGDGRAKLARAAAYVEHQPAERQQVFDERGALVDVVLGHVAREDVVVLVRHRRVERVLARLGVAHDVARQEHRDTVYGLELTIAARAAQRFAVQRRAAIRAGKVHRWRRDGNDGHRRRGYSVAVQEVVLRVVLAGLDFDQRIA